MTTATRVLPACHYGTDQELIDTLAREHIGLDEPTVAQGLAQGEPVQIADLKEAASSVVNEIILRAGFRAVLVAPLLRGDDVVGLLVVRRRTPGAFPQNTVDLIKTFAAQSAVAIENARLFQNVEASLEELRTAQDRLVQTQKLASLGQLTAGIAHEIKNPLNFVNNFSSCLGPAYRRIAGGTRQRPPRQQATRRDQRDCGYAAGQSGQGRTARQACRCYRKEYAVAFSGTALASIGQSISMLSLMKASISPIMERGPRSKASQSHLSGPLTRLPVRSICSRRRLRGRCST